jgi:hypothetical protein
MEFLENDEYKSVHPKYYNYSGKSLLTLDYKNELVEYNAINIFAYTIYNEKKYPFQQFLLTKSVNNTELAFPKIQLFNNFNKNELIDYTKVCLFGFLMLENYELFNDLINFDGFYEYNNSLYLFFDLTKNKFQLYDDIFSDRVNDRILWFGLIDEIVNHTKICNIKINEFVTQFFQENQSLCFLADENDSIYELPITSFISKSTQKLNYTYIFGQIKDNKNGILGPYYYFKDYYNAYEEALTLIKDDTTMVIVRFALFIGNVKYIENYPNDPIDESEIKRQRLQDQNLDQNIERLTMRISDHDGKWADNYDSVYLGNLELDDGNLLNKQLFVVKEYEQQIPLSYHFVNNKSLKGKKEDYLIL